MSLLTKFLVLFLMRVALGQEIREQVNPKCSQSQTLPQIEVTDAVGEGGIRLPLKIYQKRLVIPPEITSFIVNCSFHKPIKWGITKGILVNNVTSVEKIRSFNQFGNWTPPCFSVNLIFHQVREEIGALYKCYALDDFDEEAIMELYPGPRRLTPPGYLYHRGRNDVLLKLKGDRSIFLQCMVSLPSVTVHFYFSRSMNENETEWILIPKSDYSYDAVRGTNLKRSFLADSNLSQFFIKCETNITGDAVIYNYTEFDVRVDPKTPETVKVFTLTTSATHEFKCDAPYPVTMKVVKEIPQVSYDISYSQTPSQFKAKATIAYVGNQFPSKDIGRVDCLKNDTLLQSWEHKLYDDADLRVSFRGVSLDVKLRTATCASIAAADISFRFVTCETFEECQMKMVCIRDRKLGCIDEIKMGTPQITPVTKSVKLPAISGKVHCLGVDVDAGETYFLNVDQITISKLIYNELSLVAVNITSKIKCSATFVAVGDTVECSCLLVKHFYARTPIWSFKLKNGSDKPILDISNISESVHYDDLAFNLSSFHYGKSKIRVFSTEIHSISCNGLFAKDAGASQTDWVLIVTIRPLKIQGADIEMVDVELTSSNISLTCFASSFPIPQIEWITPENVGIHVRKTRLNETTLASTIYIIDSYIDFEGNYTCTATTNQTEVGGGIVNANKLFILLKKKIEKGYNENLAQTVLIITAAVFVAISIATTVYIKLRRKRIRAPEGCLTVKEIGEFLEGNPNVRGDNGYENAQRMPFVTTRYQINLTNLQVEEENPLGEGAYGIVVKGVLKGLKDEASMKVAVKKVKPNAEIEYLRALLGELKVMAYIGNHENIAELIGAVTSNLINGDLLVVISFYANGGLDKFLVNNRETFINHVKSRQLVPITTIVTKKENYENHVCGWRHGNISTLTLLQWSLEIALGMEYLSSKKVIHGDLACRNILLDEHLVAKISDFGLARQLYNYAQYVKTTQAPLPWRSMAIETICDMSFSIKSDVWAYGVTLWEIYSLGELPYPGVTFDDLFIAALKRGYRMLQPDYALNECYEIMSACWEHKPNDRPDFSEIVSQQKEVITTSMEIMMKTAQLEVSI